MHLIQNLKINQKKKQENIADQVKSKCTISGDMNHILELINREIICTLQIIESRLKVSLPADLSAALMDGVVLCHLANHVRPRSVSSIHVPSPAVVRLSND